MGVRFGKVIHLVRVILEIEKLCFFNARVADQLPTFIPHGPLHVLVGKKERMPPL